MLKMPSFNMNTRPQTSVPFMHCVIDGTFMSHVLRQTLLQFINLMNLMSVANVSVHASVPKGDILAFILSQEYTKY